MILDAGIVIRIAYVHDSLSARIVSKILSLDKEGWEIGYGLESAVAVESLRNVEASLILFDDAADVFQHWRRLVAKYRITGKSVHDANVVATALAHGATHILTLNERDFRRYSEVVLP